MLQQLQLSLFLYSRTFCLLQQRSWMHHSFQGEGNNIHLLPAQFIGKDLIIWWFIRLLQPLISPPSNKRQDNDHDQNVQTGKREEEYDSEVCIDLTSFSYFVSTHVFKTYKMKFITITIYSLLGERQKIKEGFGKCKKSQTSMQQLLHRSHKSKGC